MSGRGVGARARRGAKRAVPHTVRRVLHRVQERERRRPGPPPGVDPTALEAVCTRWTGAPLESAWHAELSGYKAANAHVVVLRAATGQRLRVVVKSLPTSPHGYPAKAGYPGPLLGPEPAILQAPSIELRTSVPTLLHVEEDPVREQQRFFLRDLSPTHHRPVTSTDVRRVLDEREQLHPALTAWLANQDDATLTTWDDDFRQRVVDWARTALEDFARATGEPFVAEFLEQWGLVVREYLRAGPDAPTIAIHGDLRRDHVFLRSRDTMRLVDWEYAGWGWAHNDLVSLFKGLEAPVVRRLLGQFAASHDELTPTEHVRVYNRAVIERGLLDAALVIRHRLAVHAHPWVHRDHFDLALAAARALHANRDLLPLEGPG